LKYYRSIIVLISALSYTKCDSKFDFAGTYTNEHNSNVLLILKENGDYQYVENGKVFNTGTWGYQNKGWLQISFHKWKDLPNYSLLDCHKSCEAIITYDGGDLIFQPDDHTTNFSKVTK
jgi:hypothetical protein